LALKRVENRLVGAIFCPEDARLTVFQCLKRLSHPNFVDSRAAMELPAVQRALFLLPTPRSAEILVSELFSGGLVGGSNNVKHLLFVTGCAFIEILL